MDNKDSALDMASEHLLRVHVYISASQIVILARLFLSVISSIPYVILKHLIH